jgi:hypothetical protein
MKRTRAAAPTDGSALGEINPSAYVGRDTPVISEVRDVRYRSIVEISP